MEPGPGGRGAALGQRVPNAAQPGEQERKLEKEKLSRVVRSIHRWLRKKYREVGDFDKIWREHCEDAETLCEYAVAMKNLADNHCAKTCEGEGRIEWCCSVCREYFQNGGKRKALEKDEKRAVLATKTTPALKRWIRCKKAHELLVLYGLLLTITPDSAHQNRHPMMMKSCKIAIESLGFKRFKYSKFSHMHPMAFRKTSLKTTSDLVSRNYPGVLYIPQDFNSVEDEEFSNPSCCVRSDIEDEQLAYGFTELPDAPYDSDSGESQASSIPF